MQHQHKLPGDYVCQGLDEQTTNYRRPTKRPPSLPENFETQIQIQTTTTIPQPLLELAFALKTSGHLPLTQTNPLPCLPTLLINKQPIINPKPTRQLTNTYYRVSASLRIFTKHHIHLLHLGPPSQLPPSNSKC